MIKGAILVYNWPPGGGGGPADCPCCCHPPPTPPAPFILLYSPAADSTSCKDGRTDFGLQHEYIEPRWLIIHKNSQYRHAKDMWKSDAITSLSPLNVLLSTYLGHSLKIFANTLLSEILNSQISISSVPVSGYGQKYRASKDGKCLVCQVNVHFFFVKWQRRSVETHLH